jgi:hypothetical protein
MNNNHEELRKELQAMSPFLEVMKPEKEGFKVPGNYFSTLADEVLWKIKVEPTPSEVNTPIRKSWLEQIDSLLRAFLQPRSVLALASVAIIIVAGIFFISPLFQPQDDFASLSHAEIQQYLINHAHELDPETLVELTELQKPANQDIDPLFLPKEEVEQYLDELSNGVDPAALEEIF